MELQNKTAWYDNLRVLATLGVICIHVSSDYVPTSGDISGSHFWIGNIFDSLGRFSVPVFVMLSGALLLSKEYPLGVFIRKRFVRLLLPFLFWSLIYIAYSFYNDYEDGISMGAVDIFRKIFVQLRDGSSLHLWYVYMIMGLYLFIPIIGKWIRQSTEKEIEYFLAIWAVVILLNQPIVSSLKPQIDLTYFTGFLGYLVLGHYLNIKTFQHQKRLNLLASISIFIGVTITIVGTFFIHFYKNEYESTFYEPLSPNILGYSAGLFLMLKNKNINSKPLIVVRNFISKYSYGIFLVHVLVLYELGDIGIQWNFIHPLIGIPLTVFLCLILSTGIIFIINKLPLGNYISG